MITEKEQTALVIEELRNRVTMYAQKIVIAQIRHPELIATFAELELLGPEETQQMFDNVTAEEADR